MEEEIRKIEKYIKVPHVYGVDISLSRYGVALPDPSYEILAAEQDDGAKQMLERRVLKQVLVTGDGRIFDDAAVATIGEQVIKVMGLTDLVIAILSEPRPLPGRVSCLPVALSLHPEALDVHHAISTTRDKTLIQKLGLLFEIADYLNPDMAVKSRLRLLRRFYPFDTIAWILNPPPATESQEDDGKIYRSRNRIITLQSFWRVEQTPLMEEFEAQFRLFVPEEMMKWRYEPRITKKFSERGIRVRRS